MIVLVGFCVVPGGFKGIRSCVGCILKVEELHRWIDKVKGRDGYVFSVHAVISFV